MRLFDRFQQGKLETGRIEAFSDGVFAIVVTLLVLELKVPEMRDTNNVGELGHRLLDLLPKFLSWMISFIIVCKFWLNHHYLLGLARHATYGMAWLNSLFLMFQSLIPFPTALLGEHPGNPLAVSIFGIVMALNTVLFLILQTYILHNLLKPELTPVNVTNLRWKMVIGPLFYLLGASAACFSTRAAFALYMITPFFFITPLTRAVRKDGADMLS
ncbi:hypothetical protein CCAX7_28010 [Capsulimonas corticalis]|uniref:Uncharacterized protein n=1 Tax=Capsulimonas corticalis TaxID=2219043 RepID=A0A402CTF4_9BACT|nr:TMEM175 family protein [Capsulimonas corticalis]BDI30750.1 hypothetical protein CCAX7_28010 [Capsulimonas corticalis]